MALYQTLRFILEHPMNRGKPISALARFAKWQVKSRLQNEVIVDWIEDAKLVVRSGMTGATGNVYCGLHEYVDMRFVLDTLRQGDLFVDIGANVGSYTVLASKVCGARTIAVEPDPGTVMALRRNLDVNSITDQVRILEVAVGAADGETIFTIGQDTTNRVATIADTEVRQVRMQSLDSILDGEVPRVIKVDVEGYEYEVFRGGEMTLKDPKLIAIITETLDRDVQQILGKAGFDQAYYDPERKRLSRRPTHLSANSLMVRRGAFSE